MATACLYLTSRASSPACVVGAALQSCPALALRGKSPSLAVVSPYGAPMPHIGRLAASIVTSPIAALHTQHHYAEAIPSHGAVFSDHFHFHVSHDERSHIVRVRPGFWRFRQESNLRCSRNGVSKAPLFRLSYETMLRWAVWTHRATGKELKVKNGI